MIINRNGLSTTCREDANRRLKQIVAELTLEKETLKAVIKKLLKPRARREVVGYIIGSFGLSQRRASVLIGLGRNALRYQPRPDRDEVLRKRIKELTEQRKQFGCWRL